MVGWHHRLNGHEFKQALGVGDGQGGWCAAVDGVGEESDTTEQLNNERVFRCTSLTRATIALLLPEQSQVTSVLQHN